MNVSALFRNYLLNLGTSRVTVKNYLSDVNHFIRWFEKELQSSFSPDLVTNETIDYYKKVCSKTLSPTSLERHISSLRKFFKFLKLNGQIPQSPFELVIPLAHEDPMKLKDFRNFLYVSNVSKLTIKNYINDIKQFKKWAEEVTKKESWIVEDVNIFAKIDQALLSEYKDRLIQNRFSPRSVNRKLSSLRKYINWSLESGFIEKKVVGELENLPKKTLVEPISKETEPVLRSGAYSSFPPLRLFQKIIKFQNFLIDTLIATPVASAIKGIEQLAWQTKGRPVFVGSVRRIKSIRNLSKAFYAPLDISTAYLPLHKKFLYHLRYTRPKWYKTYHSYSVSHYLHLAVLILIMSGIGFAIYDSLSPKLPPTEGQVLAALNNPPRLFSFQGRLTDPNDVPITTTTNLRFALYESPTASGGALKWQEVQTVTPDVDGVFSVLLGKKTALAQSIFTIHSGLWLGITVGTTAELTPRQQVASVAFAQNSDLLQGLRPITETGAGTSNVILALDSSGNLVIGGTATPTFEATGGRFTLSGNVLRLTTLAGSDSNIQLNPDDLGKIDLQKPIQNTTNNNNLTTARGAVEIDDLFAVLATSSGQSAFTLDQNSTGPIISASASGAQRFTVDNSGNTTIAGNFLSTLTASRDLGSSSVRWNNLWVQTINATGTNTSGQASFTYDPTDTTYAQGTVLINPTSAGPNELLLGAGIGGVERASIDTEGDLVLGFAGGTVTRNSNPLTVYNHGTTQIATIDISGNTYLAGSLGIGVATTIGTLNIQSADSGVTTASGASDELVIEGSGNSGISILTPNTANAQISFGDPQDNNVGNINYLHSENRMQFRTAGLSTGLDIDSSGEVGIGTTTPGNKLEVSDTTDTAIVALIRGSNTGTSVGIYRQFAVLNQNTSVNTQTGIALQHYNASSAIKDAAVINASLSSVTAGSENGYLTFSTINAGSLAERMRIDNSGNVTISSLVSCNTIDTDSSGLLVCGTDAGAQQQTFTAGGTWTKPSGAILVHVVTIGAGGGGGGGAKDVQANQVSGGGGGGGGAYEERTFSSTALSSTETVTIGTGGTAGSGGTSNPSTGTSGGAGGTSSFGSHLSAAGGSGGGGGSLSGSASGGSGGTATGPLDSQSGVAGGAGNPGTGSNGNSALVGGPGGGGGGGHNAGGSGNNGGAGGTINTTSSGGGGTAGTAGTPPTAGGTGTSRSGTIKMGDGGGGGGGSNGDSTNGGAGGAGGAPGAGGGGGGGGTTTSPAGGAGGVGGRGEVMVWTVTGGTGADLAEIYFSTDMTLDGGDLVVVDPEFPRIGFKKSSSSYDPTLLGIVSTRPGLVLGDDSIPDRNAKPVQLALAGRVPVKVTTINGKIKPGDPITSSDIPGIGMKSTKPGTIVGIAMETFDGTNCDYETKISDDDLGLVGEAICVGKIMAFVNPGYNDPRPPLIATAEELGNFVIEKAIDEVGNIIAGAYVVKDGLGNVIERSEVLASAAIGNLRAGFVESNEIKTDVISPLQGSKVVIRLEDKPLIATDSSTGSIHSKPVLEIQNSSGSAVAVVDDEGNASFSGTLNSFGLISESASISGTLTTKNLIAENIESSLLTLKDQISSISGSLTAESVNNYADIASYSAELAYVDTLQAEMGTFMQGLFAVGPSSLSDVTIFGQLSVGTSLILADNSINVLGSDLQIQSLGQGGVSFLAGKVLIDVNGNLEVSGSATIKGTLFANVLSPVPGSEFIEIKNASGSAVATISAKGEATFKKLNLSLIEPAFALSETELLATGSAGIATISANFKEVTIQNELVTEKSLIYISPVGTPSAQIPYLLRLNPKDEFLGLEASFTIGVQDLLDLPLPFNWLIIN